MIKKNNLEERFLELEAEIYGQNNENENIKFFILNFIKYTMIIILFSMVLSIFVSIGEIKGENNIYQKICQENI